MCGSLGSGCQISAQSVGISGNTGQKIENGAVLTLEGHSSTIFCRYFADFCLDLGFKKIFWGGGTDRP